MFESRSTYRGWLAPVALTLAGTTVALYIGLRPSLDQHLNDALRAKTINQLVTGVKGAIIKIGAAGLSSVEYDGGKRYNEVNNINPNAITIAKTDSPLVRRIYEEMGNSTSVRPNAEWVVFAPNVTSEGRDVNGLSIGQKIVFVDTVADNGAIKSPEEIPSVLGHEDEHENPANKSLPRLLNETKSNYRMRSVIEFQMSREYSRDLQALYDSAQKTIDTGEFLQKFGSDFQDVYPESVILANNLLGAKIPISVLQEYKNRMNDKTGIEHELYVASLIAEMALSGNKNKAITSLYSYAANPKLGGSLEQVNAASALQFLLPGALIMQSTGNLDLGKERYVSFNFGSGTNAGVAGVFPGSGFSVSGLPPLEDLLNPKTTPQGTYVTVRMYDGDTVRDGGRKYGLFGNKVLLIPKKEGKPANDWIVVKVRALDTDNNGINDTLEVYYTYPGLDFDDGLMTKVDEFNRMRFVESGLVKLNSTLKADSKGIDFNLERQWRDWNLER